VSISDNVRRKETRFLTASLLEREKAEHPLLDQRKADRSTVLSSRVGRFFVRIAVDDRCKRVAGLNAAVAKETEQISVNSFVPLFVTTFIMPPVARPNSGK
jgi:hypothetical protein